MKRSGCVLAFAAFVATTANAAIQVQFDAADSNIGAGLYAFTLSGAVAPATFNSVFDLFHWSTIGNTQNPLVGDLAPGGWTLTSNDIDNSRWYYQNTAGAVNGVFEVTATANLHGSLAWMFADSGHAENVTGTVFIPAVPEPAPYGKLAAAMLVACVIGTGASRRGARLRNA